MPKSFQFPIATTKSQGFSLIELLISMALLAIMIGVGASIFLVINNTNSRAVAYTRLQTQGSQNIEVLEKAIRSAGQAQVLNAGDTGCLSGAASCLSLRINSDTIEQKLNNRCYYTLYAWYAPTSSSNGRLVRYHRTQTLTSNACPAGTIADYDLFDSDLLSGISVEQVGATPLFSVIDGANGIDQVKFSMTLIEGIGRKRSSGPEVRTKVDFVNTVNMRTY